METSLQYSFISFSCFLLLLYVTCIYIRNLTIQCYIVLQNLLSFKYIVGGKERKYVTAIFYTCLYIYHFWCSSFLHFNSVYTLVFFSFSLEKFSLVFLVRQANQQQILSVFVYLGVYFIFAFHFHFVEKRIFGWPFFTFSTLNASFHCLLAFIASDEKSAVDFYRDFFVCDEFFFFYCFPDFVFDFQQFGYDALGVDSLMLIVCPTSGFIQLLGSVDLFFHEIWKAVFLQNNFLLLFLSSMLLGSQLHLCCFVVSRSHRTILFFNFPPSVHHIG